MKINKDLLVAVMFLYHCDKTTAKRKIRNMTQGAKKKHLFLYEEITREIENAEKQRGENVIITFNF